MQNFATFNVVGPVLQFLGYLSFRLDGCSL